MEIRAEDLTFESGGDTCRAWFIAPADRQAARPCIVLGHGLGLTRRSGLREIAEAFARAGYSALAFDYRSFGDSEGSPRQTITFRGQLEDWSAALRFARSLPGVDETRVVTWGFSLGGGHAVKAAARDGAVAAVVTVAPMWSGLSSTIAAMRWWSLPVLLRLASRGLLDVVRALLRRAPVLVPLSAPAGKLGLLTSPDAYPGYEAVVPGDFVFGTAARIALYFWTYAPGRAVGRIRAPVLVVPCSDDQVCPPGPTRRRSAGKSHVEVHEIECEHMAAIAEPVRGRVIDITLEFLGRRLPKSTPLPKA